MFILFTNLFFTRPFRLKYTLECYNLRGGQRGSTEVYGVFQIKKDKNNFFFGKFLLFRVCIKLCDIKYSNNIK